MARLCKLAVALTGLLWVAHADFVQAESPIDCVALRYGGEVVAAGCDPKRSGCRPTGPRLSPPELPLPGAVHLLLVVQDAELDRSELAFRWLPVDTPGITYKITVRDEQEGTDLDGGETRDLIWKVSPEKATQFVSDRVYEVTVEALPLPGQDPLPRRKRLDSRRFQVRSIAERERLRNDLLGICRQPQPPRQQALALADRLGVGVTAIATLEAARDAAPVAGDRPVAELDLAIARLAIELGWQEKALPAVVRAQQVWPTVDTPQGKELEQWYRLLIEP